MLRFILIALISTVGIIAGLIGLWMLFKEYREYYVNKARLKSRVDFVADAATHYITIQSLGRKPVHITAVRYFIMPHSRWEKLFKGFLHRRDRWLWKQEFPHDIALVQGDNPPIAISLPSKLKIYKIYKAELIDEWGDSWRIVWPTKELAALDKEIRHKQQPLDFAIQKEEPVRVRRHYHPKVDDPYGFTALLTALQNTGRELWLFFAEYPKRQRDKMRLRSVTHFDFKTKNPNNATITLQSLGVNPVTLTTIRYFIMPQGLWRKLFRDQQHRKGRWLYEQELTEKIHLHQGEQATVAIDLPYKIKLHRIYKAQVIVQSRQRCAIRWPSLSKLAVFKPAKIDIDAFFDKASHRHRQRLAINQQKKPPISLRTLVNQAIQKWQMQWQQRREKVQNRSHLVVKASFDFTSLDGSNNSITVQSLGKRPIAITTVRYFITPHGFWRKLFRNTRHRQGRWLWDQQLTEKIRLSEGEQTTIKIVLPRRVRLSSIYKVEVIEQTRQRWLVAQWPSPSKLATFIQPEPTPVTDTAKSSESKARKMVRVRKRKSYAGDGSTLHGAAHFSFTSPTQHQRYIELHSEGKSPVIIESIRYYIMPRSKWKRLWKNWQHRKGLWLWDQEILPNVKVIEGEAVSVNIELPSKIKIYKIYKVEAIDQLGRHWVIEWPTAQQLATRTSVEQLDFFEQKNNQRLCRARGFRLGERFYVASQFGEIAGKTERLSQRDFWLSDVNSYQCKYQELEANQCRRFLLAEIDEIT